MYGSHFLRLRIRLAEGVYGYGLHNLLLERTIGKVCIALCNLIYILHTLNNHTECGVLAFEGRRCLVHDKELASRGVGHHASCHGENALRVL